MDVVWGNVHVASSLFTVIKQFILRCPLAGDYLFDHLLELI